MSKRIYSLALTDEVIDAIDDQAGRLHLSRSALIDRILAEHVSLSSPDKRREDIFSLLEKMMEESFLIPARSGNTMMSLHSSLRYRYRPTIRYRVELSPEPDGEVFGRLRIGFRTQSPALLEALDGFFERWIPAEEHYLDRLRPQKIDYQKEDCAYVRPLFLPLLSSHQNDEDISVSIGEYVSFIDRMIKQYFVLINEPEKAEASLNREWEERARNGTLPEI